MRSYSYGSTLVRGASWKLSFHEGVWIERSVTGLIHFEGGADHVAGSPVGDRHPVGARRIPYAFVEAGPDPVGRCTDRRSSANRIGDVVGITVRIRHLSEVGAVRREPISVSGERTAFAGTGARDFKGQFLGDGIRRRG